MKYEPICVLLGTKNSGFIQKIRSFGAAAFHIHWIDCDIYANVSAFVAARVWGYLILISANENLSRNTLNQMLSVQRVGEVTWNIQRYMC